MKRKMMAIVLIAGLFTLTLLPSTLLAQAKTPTRSGPSFP